MKFLQQKQILQDSARYFARFLELLQTTSGSWKWLRTDPLSYDGNLTAILMTFVWHQSWKSWKADNNTLWEKYLNSRRNWRETTRFGSLPVQKSREFVNYLKICNLIERCFPSSCTNTPYSFTRVCKFLRILQK